MKKYCYLAFVLLFIACVPSIFGQDTVRAGITWQVQKYALDVTLPSDAQTRSITVQAMLELKNVSPNPASTLTLRISSQAEVSSVKVNGAVVDFSKSEEKINAGTSLQRIVTRSSSTAAGGTLTATVIYKLNIKDNSPLASLTQNEAQLLPLSFWYPTPTSWFFTRGADTAPFSLTVKGASNEFFTSGQLISKDVGFEQKVRGQPFFLAGKWETVNTNGVSVLIPPGSGEIGRKRAVELAALMSEARDFTAGIFGTRSDLPLRIISARRGAGFSSGGTIIVDEAVFRRSKVDSLTAMNIAEGMAKLWLGNQIDVNGEGYGIISEGLSRFIATQFIESRFGKDVADIERLRQRNAYAAISDRDAPLTKVSPLDDFYFSEVANKGAMAWRILAKRVGTAEFAKILRTNIQDGDLSVADVLTAFADQKELVDYLFDHVTDMNLMAGLPQPGAGETKVDLRNTGSVDVTVDVTATTATGEQIAAPTTIKATSFGQVSFKTNAKIVRVEIDAEKLYPQMNYSDDVSPRETAESNPLIEVKQLFDKQKYSDAEKISRTLLKDLPRFDDLRIFLGRTLLAQNKVVEAEKEFRAVLDEKLPTARSLAWANVGLGETASRVNQKDSALKYAETAILADADYGASLAARTLRNKLGLETPIEASVKAYFSAFDKAATSNRKADVDLLVMPGEVSKFAGGVSGSTELWQTQVTRADALDENTVLVEANMNVKLLNKPAESGLAVFRLSRAGGSWKLRSVDIFEVR